MPFEAETRYCPAASSVNSYRPSRSVVVPRDSSGLAFSRETLARRSGMLLSAARMRPLMVPVPVFAMGLSRGSAWPAAGGPLPGWVWTGGVWPNARTLATRITDAAPNEANRYMARDLRHESIQCQSKTAAMADW